MFSHVLNPKTTRTSSKTLTTRESELDDFESINERSDEKKEDAKEEEGSGGLVKTIKNLKTELRLAGDLGVSLCQQGQEKNEEIAKLNKLAVEKDHQIESLTQRLRSQSDQNDDLIETNQTLNQRMQRMNDMLSTANREAIRNEAELGKVTSERDEQSRLFRDASRRLSDLEEQRAFEKSNSMQSVTAVRKDAPSNEDVYLRSDKYEKKSFSKERIKVDENYRETNLKNRIQELELALKTAKEHAEQVETKMRTKYSEYEKTIRSLESEIKAQRGKRKEVEDEVVPSIFSGCPSWCPFSNFFNGESNSDDKATGTKTSRFAGKSVVEQPDEEYVEHFADKICGSLDKQAEHTSTILL